MTLTTQQLATLKAFILADSVMSTMPNNQDGDYDIAVLLNKPATPSFTVWKTSVPVDEIMRNGMDWTRVDNLSVGKARIWDWMTRLGQFNPSKTNIRAGIDATWVGTTADLAVRDTVYTHCKKDATVFEKLFATGTGTIASPATVTFDTPVSQNEVNSARNS
jgi:hypothetical protein